jgi:pyruvate,water dikinase
MEHVVWLDEVDQNDSAYVGKKCANLGALRRAGFPTPNGFAVAISAYRRFYEETGLREKVAQALAAEGVGGLDPADPANHPVFARASARARALFAATPVPPDLAEAIRGFYGRLAQVEGTADLPVATRSAGPVSRPGQYETYLYVRGAEAVLEHVVRVWSSTFNTRSLIARAKAGPLLDDTAIGVAVIAMVPARASGVLFTAEPQSGDPAYVYVESNWGLGEAVVAGEANPDAVTVRKDGLAIVRRITATKRLYTRYDPESGAVTSAELPEAMRQAPSIDDEEVRRLAEVGVAVERHFGEPQDIEWAIAEGSRALALLQTRPIRKGAAVSPTDQIVDRMLRKMGGP